MTFMSYTLSIFISKKYKQTKTRVYPKCVTERNQY